MIPGRLVRAEINLGLYKKNYTSVRALLHPSTKLMAVVKGNAYGHGIVAIAKKAEALGVDYFGVVCLHEARELRQSGIKTPILLLNYTDIESLDEALDLNLSVNVMDAAVLTAINAKANKKRKTAIIHIKVDSGMHRLGIMPRNAIQFVVNAANTKHVFVEGIFTHFASADVEDLSFAYHQLHMFKEVVGKLSKMKISPPLIHAANSAATLRIPESHFSMVRPGKILYGPLPPASYSLPFIAKPILTLKTKIVQIRKIKRGESVGYGRAFTASHNMLIASLPVGYADGFRRSPDNFGEVLVRGQRSSVVGRVSMDQSSIDITRIKDASVGDEVVIIGRQGVEEITTEEVAHRIGTINYEVITSLSDRVTRQYIE